MYNVRRVSNRHLLGPGPFEDAHLLTIVLKLTETPAKKEGMHTFDSGCLSTCAFLKGPRPAFSCGSSVI